MNTGFYNSNNWADDPAIIKAINTTSKGHMKKYGQKGVDSLEKATPKRTGETAGGWYYEVLETKPGEWTLTFGNSSHPESPLNIATLIDRGHYTRTHGYVPPYPFIYQALSGIMAGLWFDFTKELIL